MAQHSSANDNKDKEWAAKMDAWNKEKQQYQAQLKDSSSKYDSLNKEWNIKLGDWNSQKQKLENQLAQHSNANDGKNKEWAAKMDAWNKEKQQYQAQLKGWDSKLQSWDKEKAELNALLKAKPKVVEVIKEVPVEIIKEVEVVKEIDFEALALMMTDIEQEEVSKSVVREDKTRGEAKEINRIEHEAREVKISKDDLKKIEGVGPKIEALLNDAGINTWRKLSETKKQEIQKILDAAGKRYSIHDPSTWPKQAKMAADGKWDELKKWQDELDGGK